MKSNKSIKVSIVDVGVGNINSLKNAINYLGIDCKVTRSKSDIKQSTHLILPGVGSFDSLLIALKENDIMQTIKDSILEGKYFLGICVGMQILMNGSEEGTLKGLEIFDGYVKKLNYDEKNNYFVPNVGFSKIFDFKKKNLFDGLEDSPNLYFTHSYGVRDIQNEHEYNIAYSKHNFNFISAINYKKICGVQFHPEKSQSTGLKILVNFFNLK
mgnify:CR=1 FL=1